ncbi:MAG: hypothetical protein U0R21_03730 [Nocardioidaceae bacterium]
MILAYAVLGAILMTKWELEAASGLPIKDTVAALAAADQEYSVIPGVVFASFGALFALAWAVATLISTSLISGWFSAALWAAIVALGAPAYFFASFANMNSVGDTFYDWDSQAAFALVSPLYLLSGVAALLAVVALVMGLRQQSSLRQVM